MITNMQSINLTDGQATPVNHAFSPASNGRNGIARWVDKEHNGGIALGFSTLDFSVREPATPTGVTRVKLNLALPIVDTTSVVPSLVGTIRGNVEFIFPAASTTQHRKDARAMVANALDLAKLGDNVWDVQTPY